jgi:hypothetical protein
MRALAAAPERGVLLTAVVVVSSISATSAARQARTSRRMSTARCRAVSSCSAATNANRTLDRAVTTDAGSPNRLSGAGSSHAIVGSVVAVAPRWSCAGAPRPDGSGRRCRVSIAVRQALVAILYSHCRNDDRPSKRS